MTNQPAEAAVRIGIDVGGTFTDGVIVRDGEVRTAKVPSRPDDVAGGILACCDQLCDDLTEVSLLIHGTTIATNAIIEKTAKPIAHVTTIGYRDVLHIRRADSKAYDLKWNPPTPVVRRRDIFEIPERMAWDGSVIAEFDEQSARRTAQIIAEKGYPAVSVVFLHSYANPAHEERMREILEETCPEAAVSISADVLPHYREFERSSTTAVNSYLMPLMADYLEELEVRAEQKGLKRSPLIMQSNGGLMSLEEARRLPSRAARSGPAGGAIAMTKLADALEIEDAVLMDIGGTSTEVAVRHQGTLRWTPQLEFAWGIPIRFPSVDIHSIGAGGGSIAWVDRGRFLKVGPHSAGAIPGPACYGRGGELSTTTDAQVVLGRLNPVALLDGAMPIDREKAVAAIEEHIARPLGLKLEEAARGILRVMTNNTMQAIRLMTVNRGHDPRRSTLIAYGGNGPVYAADVARLLEISSVIIPAHSGVSSALGMVQADFEYDESVTILQSGGAIDAGAIAAALTKMEGKLAARLAAAGIADRDQELSRYLDVRYEGQGYELAVKLDSGDPEDFAAQFHHQHELEFGWRQESWPLEVVFARVLARGVITGKAPAGANADRAPGPTPSANGETRECHFLDQEGTVRTPVVKRRSLAPGDELDGPLILEQMDTTTVVPPGFRAIVDRGGNLVLVDHKPKGSE